MGAEHNEISETFFRIRREDGKFSTGGGWPRFSRKGKIWQSSTALASHFALHSSAHHQNQSYQSCEVVEYTLAEKLSYPVTDVFERLRDRRAERERKRTIAACARCGKRLKATEIAITSDKHEVCLDLKGCQQRQKPGKEANSGDGRRRVAQ